MKKLTILFLIGVLAGCTTVSTRYYKSENPAVPLPNWISGEFSEANPFDKTKSAFAEPGMIYMLPKKLMKLKVTTTKIDKEKLEKRLASENQKLATATSAAKDAKTEFERLKAIVEQLKTKGGDQGSGPYAASYEEQLKLLNSAEAVLALALRKQKALAEIVATTKLEISALNGAASKCLVKTSISAGQTVGDTSYMLIANPRHSWLRDDNVKLSVNEKGLLSAANAVATDQTGEIFAEFSKAIALTSFKFGDVLAIQGDNPNNCVLDQPFEMEFDPKNTDRLNDVLKARKIPVAVYGPQQDAFLPNQTHEFDTDTNAKNADYAGLFYRTQVPVPIETHVCLPQITCPDRANKDDAHIVGGTMVMLPQYGPIGFIPMRSSIFVETVGDVSFKDGSLLKWDTSRPSEVLEAIRLPVRVLISEPVKAIGEGLGLVQSQQSFSDALISQSQSQIRLDLLNRCIESAEQSEDREAALEACLL